MEIYVRKIIQISILWEVSPKMLCGKIKNCGSLLQATKQDRRTRNIVKKKKKKKKEEEELGTKLQEKKCI
jgi:hypothetical protein